jgi:hypothetical protein
VKPNWNRLQNAGSEILEFIVDSLSPLLLW